ncbi:MAG TPA: prolyl oligopeptidase family serine peptidase, partial [Vicinamibacterales bacterium]
MEQPYGTWPSPITAALVAAQGLRLSSVAVDGDAVYWVEGRPSEGGRNVVVRRTADGSMRDVVPAGFNARTRVHEYGGGAYLVNGRHLYFSNFTDQRLYVADLDGGDRPAPLTPEGAYCYADASLDQARRRLICVREDHTQPGREAATTLVGVPLDGGDVEVLAAGQDFYSTPRLSPDGARVCWLSWQHPRMPWDGTELWVADVRPDGRFGPAGLVAGGATESIYQPGWLADGTIVFASDRDGWWRLYRSQVPHAAGGVEPVLRTPPPDAEFGRPQWVFGTATWASAGPGRLVVSFSRGGRWYLGRVETSTGTLSTIADQLHPHDWLSVLGADVVLVAGSSGQPAAVVAVGLETGVVRTLKRASSSGPDETLVAVAEPIEFPTAGGHTAHAFYYRPRNGDWSAPAGERPPLIVIGHGGPIAAADCTLDLKVQYWTTRGFAVVDVNYGGSTGFGRDYRRRLNGQWGIVDVADLVHAARHMVATGKADP